MDELQKPIMFSNFPPLYSLIQLVIQIDPHETKGPKSDLQFQLFKTRCLLHKNKDLIAGPSQDDPRLINIICKREYYTERLLSKLMKQKLKVGSLIQNPQRSTLEACLFYTIIFKLCPHWYPFEKYLIMGTHFLSQRGFLKAITLNLSMQDTNLLLFCHPKILKLVMLQIEEFDLPLEVLERMNSGMFFYNFYSSPYLVYVLPSFKRGRLMYVTNRIPKASPFGSYEDISEHWKHTYGFILPNESTMIYVGVNFYGPETYTYPLCCVRKGIHEGNGQPSIVHDFLKIFISSVSQKKILGEKLILISNPFQAIHDDPKAMLRLKIWNKEKLLELEKRIIYNFINPTTPESPVFRKWEVANNSNIVVKREPEDDDRFMKVENTEDEDWTINCENFIDGLSQANPKRTPVRRPLPSTNSITNTRRARKMSNSIFRKPIFIEFPPPRPHTNVSQLRIKTEPGEEEDGVGPNLWDPLVIKEERITQPSRDHIHSGIRRRVPGFLPDKNMNTIPAKASPRQRELNNIKLSNVKDTKMPRKIDKEQSVEDYQTKKPPLLPDMDIESLARIGQLKKVNVPSLLQYLKNHRVVCNLKDKKQGLMLKTESLLKRKNFI